MKQKMKTWMRETWCCLEACHWWKWHFLLPSWLRPHPGHDQLATTESMSWHTPQGLTLFEKPWGLPASPAAAPKERRSSAALCGISQPHIFYPSTCFQQHQTFVFSNRLLEGPRLPLTAMVPAYSQPSTWRLQNIGVLTKTPNLHQPASNFDEANKEQQDVKEANSDYKLKGILFDN